MIVTDHVRRYKLLLVFNRRAP